MTAAVRHLFTAHGLSEPLEVEIERPGDPPRTQRLTLEQPWAILGRSDRATIPLHESGISRRHAYLQVIGGRFFIVDLDSRAGMTLDGARVTASWIDPGHTLSLNSCRLRIVSTHDHPFGLGFDPLEDRMPAALAGADARFAIFQRDQQVAQWKMNRALALVGTSARCRVRLVGDVVSRIHCSFVATPDGVWAVDLVSRAGLYVNDQRVPYALLSDGDKLRLGDYELRYHYARQSRPRMRARVTVLDLPKLPEPEEELPTTDALPAPATAPVPATPVVVVNTGNEGLLAPFALSANLSPQEEQRLVMPLVQQFSALQQHMFDQFNQTMVMMVQMLSAMQREQVALIRDEMQHFQKATEELTSLRAQLEASKSGRGASTPAPATHSSSRWAPGAWPGANPASQPTTPGAADAPQRAATEAKPGPEAADEEVHVWLHERIEELQTERQNSWQRIMDFIRGH